MEVAYYNLSGGINQALTKTELGIDTKKIYWSDSENVEIHQNRGIKKQSGNTLFLNINEKITGLAEMSAYDKNKLVITTISGKIYVYDNQSSSPVLVNKTLTGVKPVFQSFLNGILVMTESDGLFYIKNNTSYSVIDCNLKDLSGNVLTGGVIAVYKGRVWAAKDATIYYSALGTYDNFTLENDAGYINEFHTDSGSITALKPYKDYLAIYKNNSVYLLTGTNYKDFAIVLFANKGASSDKAITNVENKQYFLSSGIYALEQVGELNQIQLGSEISSKIRKEFSNFGNLKNTIALHYENKNQIWYFFPYADEDYFLLDTEYDNNFNFSVYKDYDSEFCDDDEHIYSVHPEHLIWADDNTPDSFPCKWPLDDENFPVWTINKDTLEKAEISESNYSVQLCVKGEEQTNDCAIIGLQFREIYNDD